jgi:hypothetical protein
MVGYINNIQGWMNDDSLSWLVNKASEMDSIVEIGCWKGRSTHALLTGCKGIVYAVDHFMGSQDTKDPAQMFEKGICEEFLKNVGMFQNLKLLKMSSEEASKLFEPKSVDMVFLDGSHTYEDVKADLESWIMIPRKLICGHDYWGWEGVRKAADEKFGNDATLYRKEDIWSFQIFHG